MKRLALLLALLAFPASASAHTTVIGGSTRAVALQRYVNQSKVPTPDMSIKVVDSRCPKPDAVACATWDDVIYLDPVLTKPVLRIVFLHELGHIYDQNLMTETRRAEVSSVMSWVGPWQQPELGHGAPLELFANLYSDCAAAKSVSPFRARKPNSLLIAPNRQKARACALIT